MVSHFLRIAYFVFRETLSRVGYAFASEFSMNTVICIVSTGEQSIRHSIGPSQHSVESLPVIFPRDFAPSKSSILCACPYLRRLQVLAVHRTCSVSDPLYLATVFASGHANIFLQAVDY